MKGFKLLLLVIMAIKAIKMETDLDTNEENYYDYDEKEKVTETTTTTTTTEVKMAEVEEEKKRFSIQVELYSDDERCSDIGVCSGMYYGNREILVTFNRKYEIRFTTDTTYRIKEEKKYFTLTFINSKFSNFPLNLFYTFNIQELDFRNCSLESLTWDSFLKSENLSILLLSENLLSEIKPELFTLAENLSFLFLDSNRLSVLHKDSFKGLTKLNYLDLHHNLLETLPVDIFSPLTSIQQINLAENRLKIITNSLFANNPRLFSIHLQQNALSEIQDVAFQEQLVLKYLDISHNPQLEVLVVGNIRVENLWAKNCSINRVNIYGEAVHVDFQQNSIKELYFSNPEYLETLRLKDNALEQISSLAQTLNLRYLDLSNNPQLITLPNVWQINSLERLDLSNTSLKEIPINVMASINQLKSLNVSYNLIEEINPLNFKYFEKLSQFYIHHNNWNCYNLQMLMDMVIKPLQISYTRDEYDDNFPGEYIQGIKCLYRLEQDDEYYVDSQQEETKSKENFDISPSSIQEYNRLNFEQQKELQKLRHEFKVIFNLYEQKFALVLNKLNDMDARLKEFERFNQTLWKDVSIVV
ncbi:leucine-rich repeat-containing G-protein coupled receptor 5 [Lucilia cuprina]|uniref:leucine-rich repeat-containing G-protein coupled receptor 5 n=1 Tax=Lucilia cuprina TaxID=7375 RepID=UPI001F066603|nr:leucine-rich repeat-containing G-protein coupled receptor 5 [Lucilia cuprina]